MTHAAHPLPFLLALILACPAIAQPPPPADAGRLAYFGDTTRAAIGWDSDNSLRGELWHVLREDERKAWIGELWATDAGTDDVVRWMSERPASLAGLASTAARLELLIGPEGGLDDAEIDAAARAGFAPVRLGPRVLRTETAGIVALTPFALQNIVSRANDALHVFSLHAAGQPIGQYRQRVEFHVGRRRKYPQHVIAVFAECHP